MRSGGVSASCASAHVTRRDAGDAGATADTPANVMAPGGLESPDDESPSRAAPSSGACPSADASASLTTHVWPERAVPSPHVTVSPFEPHAAAPAKHESPRTNPAPAPFADNADNRAVQQSQQSQQSYRWAHRFHIYFTSIELPRSTLEVIGLSASCESIDSHAHSGERRVLFSPDAGRVSAPPLPGRTRHRLRRPHRLQPPPSSPSPDAKEQARIHFTAGVNLLQDPEKPRYEEAYAEFKRAYELVKSPSILGNIGLCAMKLERDAEAIDAYKRYLAEMQTLAPEERAQVERDVLTLQAGLARVSVESHPDGALINDTHIAVRGESVTNLYGPLHGKTELGLRRGHHVLKARYPDGTEVAWEADVTGGESHVFDHPVGPPSPGRRRRRAGVRQACPRIRLRRHHRRRGAAAGAAATGVVALNEHSRFDAANDGSNPSHAADLRSSGQTLNIVSDALLGATVVCAIATAYVYFARPSVRVGPTTGLIVTPGGVFGRF